MQELKNFCLNNGLSVTYLDDKTTNNFSINVDIHSGSRDDLPGLEGQHHIGEHLPMDGTRSFPTTQAWAAPLECIGLDPANVINTGKTRTRFGLEMLGEDLLLGATHLSELVYLPLLREADLSAQKQTILKEWRGKQNDQSYIFGSHLNLMTFPGTRLAHAVLGEPSTIMATTVAGLVDMYRNDYTASNSQIVLAGNIPPSFERTLDLTFGQLEIPFGASRRQTVAPPKIVGQHWEAGHKIFSQPMFAIFGFFGEINSRTAEALRLFQTILGTGTLLSGILFDALRLNRQLVYDFGTSCKFTFPGLYQILFLCHCDYQQTDLVRTEFWRAVEGATSNVDRFEFAVRRHLRKLKMHTFKPHAEAEDIADNLLNRGEHTLNQERGQIIESLSFEEVQTTARKYFNPEHFNSLLMKA